MGNKNIEGNYLMSTKKLRAHLRPVTSRPILSSQLDVYLTLYEIAYSIWIASNKKLEVTVVAVSGAVRSLGLKAETIAYSTMVKGSVIFRQQTMIHKSKLPLIRKYIEGKQAA